MAKLLPLLFLSFLSLSACFNKSEINETDSAEFTPEEALANARESLTFETIRLQNKDANQITSDLNLIRAIDEVAVAWDSTPLGLIDGAGRVTPPEAGKSDV